MFRKTLTILSLIGLLLTTAALCASTRYSLSYVPESLRFQVTVLAGEVYLHWPSKAYRPFPPGYFDDSARGPRECVATISGKVGLACAGLRISRNSVNISYSVRMPRMRRVVGRLSTELVIEIPLWIPIIILGTLSGLLLVPSWRRRRGRRRRRRGLCVACGYDLRGSIAYCPECNTECGADTQKGAIG